MYAKTFQDSVSASHTYIHINTSDREGMRGWGRGTQRHSQQNQKSEIKIGDWIWTLFGTTSFCWMELNFVSHFYNVANEQTIRIFLLPYDHVSSKGGSIRKNLTDEINILKIISSQRTLSDWFCVVLVEICTLFVIIYKYGCVDVICFLNWHIRRSGLMIFVAVWSISM